MLARATTWWTILKMCVAERVAYRGDFIIGTTMRFLPVVTQVFLWTAVYAEVSGGQISGFTRDDVVAYYLLTMVARAFSSMPGLASKLARQIREGEIKKFLIQPIDLLTFLLLSRMGHKAVYYGVAILPFTAVFLFCGSFFPPWPTPDVFAVFCMSLVLGFLLGFYLEVTLGMLGFWLLEVSALLFVYMLFNFFFSGHMFPLDFLPQPWRGIVDYFPLKYLAYFPAAVWLGKVSGVEMWRGLAIEAAWVLFFIGLSRYAMHRGFRRYSGYGG